MRSAPLTISKISSSGYKTLVQRLALTSRVAAVHGERVADGEGGEVGTKEKDHGGDLFRLRKTPNRGIGQEKAAHCRIVEPMFRHRGFHQSRCQRVNADSLVCIFDRRRLG